MKRNPPDTNIPANTFGSVPGTAPGNVPGNVPGNFGGFSFGPSDPTATGGVRRKLKAKGTITKK